MSKRNLGSTPRTMEKWTCRCKVHMAQIRCQFSYHFRSASNEPADAPRQQPSPQVCRQPGWCWCFNCCGKKGSILEAIIISALWTLSIPRNQHISYMYIYIYLVWSKKSWLSSQVKVIHSLKQKAISNQSMRFNQIYPKLSFCLQLQIHRNSARLKPRRWHRFWFHHPGSGSDVLSSARRQGGSQWLIAIFGIYPVYPPPSNSDKHRFIGITY